MNKSNRSAINKDRSQSLTEIIITIFRLKAILLDNGNGLARPMVTDSNNWQVLGALALTTHPMTAPMVAESMGMTRQGTQKRLNKLAQEGLVKPHANPRHDRSPIWTLTDEGMIIFNFIMVKYDLWLGVLLPILQSTSEEFSTTFKVLQELETVLNKIDIARDILSGNSMNCLVNKVVT